MDRTAGGPPGGPESPQDDERFRAIFERAPCGILLVSPAGVYLDANPAVCDMLGRPKEAVVGRPTSAFVPPGQEAQREHIRRSLGESGEWRGEFPLVRGDGTLVELEWHVSRYSPAGAMLAVVTDVTAHKRAREALEEADRRKDEFLAVLSHELRNPLAPIRNAVAVMREGRTPERYEWARDVIGRQVESLGRLVEDLLDVSRITQGKITLQTEPVALADVVARAVETARPHVDERGHRLEVRLADEEIFVEADPTRLAQVIANLLHNASKYTEPGGALSVTTDAVGGEAVVRVRDTGRGIPRELLPRVFDLFTQADGALDRATGGLGIGLTVARSLVEMHDGELDAFSDGPGRGSEFVVRLPRRQGPPPAAPEPAPRPAAGAAPRRVLVVDDSADSADSMAMYLTIKGHHVRVVYDGASAIEEARAFAPDVVLLDIGLPGMNGYEVADRLRSGPPGFGALLVAMTGYGRAEDRRRTAEHGFAEHLVKPVDPETVIAILARL